MFGMGGRMMLEAGRVTRIKNVLGPGHLRRRAVGHHQKSVGLDGGLIFQDAVLRNTKAAQRGAQGAQATHNDRALRRR